MGRSDGRVLGVTQIVNNGAASRRWNIVLLGDGFLESEQPLFNNAAQNFADTLFSLAPFSDRLRNAVNIFRGNVASMESGIDDPASCGGTGVMVRTFFDGSSCNRGLPRLSSVNEGLAWDIARELVPQVHAVIVVLNSSLAVGSGGSAAAYSLGIGPGIAIHEMGHSAFGLADEYESWRGCGLDTDRDVHGFTFFDLVEPNVTVHEELENLIVHKWGRFVNWTTDVPTMDNPDCTICDPNPSPVPVGTVGLFEGAHYYHCDAYRPEFNCMMRSGAPFFCRACSEHMLARLARFIPVPLDLLQNFELVFTSKNSGKVVDVEDVRLDNGAPIQQWDWAGGYNQKWGILNISEDICVIISMHSGRLMDVWGISMNPGAPVHQWALWGGDNQRWHIEDIGEGYCRLVAVHSGMCLDVPASSRANGTNLIQWPWNGGDNQKWRISTAELAFMVVHTNKALDVSGISRADGATVHQWDWWGGPNQKWRMEYVGEGYFKIISVNSGKVLDVQDSRRRNGGRVQQWEWHGGENQQWRVEPVGGGFYKIIARHSGLCLEVGGIRGDNGAPVVQWTYVGGDNQKWRIVSAS